MIWHTYTKRSEGPTKLGKYLVGTMRGDECGNIIDGYEVFTWNPAVAGWEVVPDNNCGIIVYKWAEIPGDDSDENSK